MTVESSTSPPDQSKWKRLSLSFRRNSSSKEVVVVVPELDLDQVPKKKKSLRRRLSGSFKKLVTPRSTQSTPRGHDHPAARGDDEETEVASTGKSCLDEEYDNSVAGEAGLGALQAPPSPGIPAGVPAPGGVAQPAEEADSKAECSAESEAAESVAPLQASAAPSEDAGTEETEVTAEEAVGPEAQAEAVAVAEAEAEAEAAAESEAKAEVEVVQHASAAPADEEQLGKQLVATAFAGALGKAAAAEASVKPARRGFVLAPKTLLAAAVVGVAALAAGALSGGRVAKRQHAAGHKEAPTAPRKAAAPAAMWWAHK